MKLEVLLTWPDLHTFGGTTHLWDICNFLKSVFVILYVLKEYFFSLYLKICVVQSIKLVVMHIITLLLQVVSSCKKLPRRIVCT